MGVFAELFFIKYYCIFCGWICSDAAHWTEPTNLTHCSQRDLNESVDK